VASVVLSVVGVLLVRKRARHSNLSDYQSFSVSMLNVVATLFAILLGFLVAQAYTQYQDVADKVSDEANRLGDIYMLAAGLSAPDRIALRTACRDYCRIVVEKEWPCMERRTYSQELNQTIRGLWQEILAFEPESDRETNIQASLIDAAQQVGEDRRSRLLSMKNALSPLLWMVVVGGCVIMVIFTYFFFVESVIMQCFMTGLVAISLIFNLMLLNVYSDPFRGVLKITPAPFEGMRSWFTQPEFIVKLKPHKKSKDDE
jgi:hypothetical protein